MPLAQSVTTLCFRVDFMMNSFDPSSTCASHPEIGELLTFVKMNRTLSEVNLVLVVPAILGTLGVNIGLIGIHYPRVIENVNLIDPLQLRSWQSNRAGGRSETPTGKRCTEKNLEGLFYWNSRDRKAGDMGFSHLDRMSGGQAVCGRMSGVFERRKNGWGTAARIAGLAWLGVSTASAHTETGGVGGFVSGFHHPLSGLDHIVAMVAVGLWGAFLGGRAMWLLPVVFPMVMAFGGAAAVLGVPLPGVETGIALSGIVLGLMVAFAAKPPLWVAAVLVGIFAIFHGHAHGSELPDAANPLMYAVGFVISTGLLHLCGIGFGVFTKWPWGRIAVRGAGVAITAVGCGFLFHYL